jgi:hypothetical protein
MISADTAGEPRTQVSGSVATAQVFGVDVDGWKPGETRYVDASAFGYPLRSLNQLKAGRYRVQAMINRYETFMRSDGHTVKVPPDKWEGQQFASKPGNLYSQAQNIAVDPSKAGDTRLVLDQEIPPVPDFKAKETKYVKYLRIKSDLLSKFWGRDMFLGAWILLPWEFDEHPDARYPVVINHGHFPSSVGVGAKRRLIPTSPRITASAFRSPATTVSSSSTGGSSTRTGPARASRECCW